MYQQQLPPNNSTTSSTAAATNSQQQQFAAITSHSATTMYGQQQQQQNNQQQHQQMFAAQQQLHLQQLQRQAAEHFYSSSVLGTTTQQQQAQNQQIQAHGIKRQMSMAESGGGGGGGQQEEKENFGGPTAKKRAYLESSTQEDQSAAKHPKADEQEEEADDEEQEDEEEEDVSISSSRKTESESPGEVSTTQTAGAGHQAAAAAVLGQCHQLLYSTPPQQQQHWNFSMPIHLTPLAHSTPFSSMPAAYSGNNNNALISNFQALTNYGGYLTAPPASQQQQYAAQHQQQLINAYGGGYDPTGAAAAASLLAAHSQQQQQLAAAASFHASSLNNSSIGSSALGASLLGNDSGLGADRAENRDGQKNESSSGGSSEESNVSGGGILALAPQVPRFPPYLRSIVLEGQKQVRDLEEITFGQLIPARLALLNNMKKYPVPLAEIHRRMGPPECLNTSYLSGILRRAKNKNGGSRLRQELGKYDAGLELQTGKRKSSQVTVFTTLCEREAIQLAEDFGKVTNDPQNGFPHHQLAMELNRRTLLHSSPEQQKQRLEGVKNSIEILCEAIGIVQQAMEQETLPLAMPGELAVPAVVDGVGKQEQAGGGGQQQQMMPQTLNQFKRFARLSHCFGNRGMLTCWQSLLKVFGQYETMAHGCFMGAAAGGGQLDFGSGQLLLPGTSAAAGLQQISPEQEQANALLDTLYNNKQEQHNVHQHQRR